MTAPTSSTSLPRAIFIDACIFDQEKFQFASPQITAFIDATRKKELKLLLPAPTRQEIEDHISNGAERAISALNHARKEHPFLHQLKSLPKRKDLPHAKYKLERRIVQSWERFLKKFDVVELGYTGVKIDEVMQWYRWGRAPFGTGEKRKEFPDAFAFAALLDYAKKSKAKVAIVSADNDFKEACKSRSDFHHFPSLAALTDALLSGKRYHKAAVALVPANKQLICDAISKDFPDRGFYHANAPEGKDYVDDVKVLSVELEDTAIIGLGHQEFTVAFSATVSYTAHAEYDDPDSWVSLGEGDVMYLERCSGPISDKAAITGTIRFTTNADWTQIEDTVGCQIEDEMIEVTADAPHCRESDDSDPLR
jgi:hypothetical protein